MSDLQMGKYCEAKNLVLAAMFNPDMPATAEKIEVTFDGNSITVSTADGRKAFGSGRDGIEAAAMTIAFVMVSMRG